MKKILALSSIRSDYDLLSPLYKLLNEDKEIDFRILVSGAHLSHSFGYSVQEIYKDGLEVLAEIETLLDTQTKISRIKSASLLLQNSLEIVAKFNPDVLIYAGDREDVLIYAMIGGYLGIPTIHCFGGDHGIDGYIDNPVRHATSKLSTYHFVTLEEHVERLVAIGESRDRIYHIGSISLDRFASFQPKTNREIFSYFNKKSMVDKFALLIFHPITIELDRIEYIFKSILEVLKEEKIFAFVSYPNIDEGNDKIISVIDNFKEDQNFIFYKNLDREIFLSIYKNAYFLIGNSSSGPCEAASIPIPVVNVGMRQVGRVADENVIFVKAIKSEIREGVRKALSDEFVESIREVRNSYGDGKSSLRAYNIIKDMEFKEKISKFEDPLKIRGK